MAAALRGYARISADRILRLNRVPLRASEAFELTAIGLQAFSSKNTRLAMACACVVFQFSFFVRAGTVGRQRLDDVQEDAGVLFVRLSHEKMREHDRRRLHLPSPPSIEGPHPYTLLMTSINWARQLHRTYWFSDSGEPASSKQIGELWRLALAASSIGPDRRAHLTPQSARAGGASTAMILGVPESIVQKRGGWRSADSKLAYVYPVEPSSYDSLFFGFLLPRVIR